MNLVTDNRAQVQRDRLIALEEVQRLTSLKKTTIYALMKAGDFPKGLAVTRRCVRWPESQVLTFIQNSIAAAGAKS